MDKSDIDISKIINATIKSGNYLDTKQQEIFNLVEKTNQNIFIQGQAGTGKSTFIRYLQNHSKKRMIILCPTAIAAINIGGETIHSMYNLPFSDFFIMKDLLNKKRSKLSMILKRTNILIIDEVSMVRPDMLDAIDMLSKQARDNPHEPFGGLQVILIGDLCQLPPIIKQNVYNIFEDIYGYKNTYFFDSFAYKEGDFTKIELSKVYRQEDPDLITNLINIRQNKDIYNTIQYFNTAKFTDINDTKFALTITPYNAIADSINHQKLSQIQNYEMTYECQTSGSFDNIKDTPSPALLKLRIGALVIFNKNNNQQNYINGTSGIVEDLKEEYIKVRIIKENRVIEVRREEWVNLTYDYDEETGKITEKETGRFIQFPLQLGYALTIHKAQGKTLDKVIIDMGNGAFAHGQTYVALSRTRKKSDMHITRPIKQKDIIQDKRVIEFINNK